MRDRAENSTGVVGVVHQALAAPDDELHNKPAHAVPLASARQHLESQKENRAGHSPERAMEGQALTAPHKPQGLLRFTGCEIGGCGVAGERAPLAHK